LTRVLRVLRILRVKIVRVLGFLRENWVTSVSSVRLDVFCEPPVLLELLLTKIAFEGRFGNGADLGLLFARILVFRGAAGLPVALGVSGLRRRGIWLCLGARNGAEVARLFLNRIINHILLKDKRRIPLHLSLEVVGGIGRLDRGDAGSVEALGRNFFGFRVPEPGPPSIVGGL